MKRAVLFLAVAMLGPAMAAAEESREWACFSEADAYKSAARMPPAGLKDAGLQKDFLAVARGFWAGTDIGENTKVLSCVVTGSKWNTLKMADEAGASGRSINGLGRYGGCEHSV